MQDLNNISGKNIKQTFQNAIDKQYKNFNVQKIIIIGLLVFIALYAFVIIGFISMIDFSNSDELFPLINLNS